MNEELEDFYTEIIQDLDRERTVLLLGPELSVNDEGIDYRSHFKNIDQIKNYDQNEYYPKENLFSVNDRVLWRKVKTEFKRFYEKVGDEVLLEMISRIKFPLIINVAPDDALARIYERNNISYKSDYFIHDHHSNEDELKDYEPTKESPIIYNIFGTIKEAPSLIMSHDKLYKTIEALLPKSSLPDCVEAYVNRASSFIFLGFTFDSWHYQLLCHKLKIHSPDHSKPSLSSSILYKNNSIMEKHFQMIFTPENPTQTIDRIIQECDNPTILRNANYSDSQSLFVSYAWGDGEGVDRDSIVSLCQSYIADNYENVKFLRDKNVMSFGDSIDSFMTRIGRGKSVIRVISDKYLKSPYCMTEALRISQYKDTEQRVFTIMWDDINEDDTFYEDYWLKQCYDIVRNINDSRSKLKKMQDGIIDNYMKFSEFVVPFLTELRDTISMNVSKTDFSDDNEEVLRPNKQQEFEQFMTDVYDKMIGND